MKPYQCRLYKLHEELGSWRAVEEHFDHLISHATLIRYAKGAIVFNLAHKKALGITRPRERRVAVHCTDIDSAVNTLCNEDNFPNEYLIDVLIKVMKRKKWAWLDTRGTKENLIDDYGYPIPKGTLFFDSEVGKY